MSIGVDVLLAEGVACFDAPADKARGEADGPSADSNTPTDVITADLASRTAVQSYDTFRAR